MSGALGSIRSDRQPSIAKKEHISVINDALGCQGGFEGRRGVSLSSRDIINSLGLIPHPEGGFFRETYRSGAIPMKSKGGTDESGAILQTTGLSGPGYDSRFPKPGPRNILTSILFMLTTNDRQCFIVNESDHVHYWQGGARVVYHLVYETGAVERAVLGPLVEEGDVFQLVVPGSVFKAAEFLANGQDDYVLIGEAVVPGFDFCDMRMLGVAELRERLGAGVEAEVLERLREFVKVERDFDREAVYTSMRDFR
jgi:uncharacterized protein